MTLETTDILVAGGGIAGMMAAMSMAAAGFDVVCVDPAPPVTKMDAEGSDLRSTAFLQPAIKLMEEAGVWERLAPYAAPLAIMRLADSGGPDGGVRTVRDFVATEVGQDVFGYNFPNWLLRREMLAHIATHERLSFRTGVGVSTVLTRSTEVRVGLTDGTRISARLVLGADGRNSRVRDALDIPVTTRRYGQKAIVFAVDHPMPHEDVSTEVHRSGGPFTLVPLPDAPDGTHRSAVVWMETGPNCDALMQLDDDGFSVAATERSAHVLGALTLASPRRIWPIISQSAERLTGQRCALIAEAAHVLPPIGAQGLNMSLRDVTTIRDLVVQARDAGEDIGSDTLLDNYARARKADIELRILGIDVLNRAAMTQSQPFMDARRRVLEALHGLTPLRQTAMKMGLGAS